MAIRVLLLSDTFSEHTEKWTLGLASKNIEVGLFSFNKASYNWYEGNKNITLLFQPAGEINAKSGAVKINYLSHLKELKKAIAHFKPDILHAHYATSYGLLGALSGFKPFVLSVWGSDVYHFPRRSWLHRMLFKFNLRKATRILSTSNIMREEILKYTDKEVIVTPFGVDTTVFSKKKVEKENDVTYIGTIKVIEDKYGIIHIIKAAKILKEKIKDRKFRFLLIGPGSMIEHYREVVKKEGLESLVEIPGRIPFQQISHHHNVLDIFLNVSIDDSESFGVAVVEAMACEKPVIVSNVGGLMEVIGQGKYGMIVNKESPQEIADAVEKLMNDPAKAEEMGKKGREHVLKNYDFEVCLAKMISVYQPLVKN